MRQFESLRGRLRKKLEQARQVKSYPKFSIREPRHFVELPRIQKPSSVDIRYPLLEPLVSTRISWDAKSKHLVYAVSEPALSEKERSLLDTIESMLTELIDVRVSLMTDREESMAYLEEKIGEVLEEMGVELTGEAYVRVLYYIFRDFLGLNEIEALMHDPYIEDIGCSGLDSSIYITHRKFGSIITNIEFTDFDILENFVIKLSERCGRYISYAMPLLDGTLPDGSRIQASLAKDITTKGPTFSIRRFRRNPFSMIDMVNFKTASPGVIAYLWFLIEHGASILIAGGVASGKTTMLNVLSMFVPPEKKIVSIEDVREINIEHENWIPATSRSGFGVPEKGGKRYGEVDLFDLLKESFRMKPDYVIVGEVRGNEAYVLFQGMASGNPSLGTIHSGSVDDVIKRLETPPIDLSPSLIESLDALIVMVNARQDGKSARRVKEVVEIDGMSPETGKAHITKVFSWIPYVDDFKDQTSQSLLLRKLSFEHGITHDTIMADLVRRQKVIEWMQKFSIVQFQEVSELINLYYTSQDKIMEMVENNTPPFKKASKGLESATGLHILPSPAVPADVHLEKLPKLSSISPVKKPAKPRIEPVKKPAKSSRISSAKKNTKPSRRRVRKRTQHSRKR